MGHALAKKVSNMAAKKQNGPVITVVPNVKANFREGTARANWYAALQAYNGKPVAAFTKHVLANPPSTPRTGKLKGQCEPPRGWLGWFARNGYITVK